MASIDRRSFMRSTAALASAGLLSQYPVGSSCWAATAGEKKKAQMRMGLVTYMWGADWDLPTLLRNCEKAGADGVELRTEHAHGVDPDISAAKREEVKKRFADSPIKFVGMGSNQDFHSPDPAKLRASIERAKAFIKLSSDIGGSGAKVKPNDLPKGVSHEKTIEQIGKSLNELGAYAADLNQQVRLEVHGGCAPLPIIAAIMEVADHPNVVVCWNSNKQDLEGKGIEYNFNLVAKRLGATTHVHDLGGKAYPNKKLFELLKGIKYNGWVLIEASDKPKDRVVALAEQRKIFDELVGA